MMNNSIFNDISNNIYYFIEQVKKIINFIYELFIGYYKIFNKIIQIQSLEINYEYNEINDGTNDGTNQEINSQIDEQMDDKINNEFNDTYITNGNVLFETKIFLNDNILNLAITQAVQIVKNIISENKFLKNNSEEKEILNFENKNNNDISAKLNYITVPNIKDTNYLNIIKKKMYDSELPNIVNNLDHDEMKHLANGLLKSMINIADNLQITDNILFNKYLNVLLKKNNILDEDNLSNDISDNNSDNVLDNNSDDDNTDDILDNNLDDILDNNLDADNSDDDNLDDDNSDDDNLDDDNLYDYNLDKTMFKNNNYLNLINHLITDYNKPKINKSINISNIIEMIDEIKIK